VEALTGEPDAHSKAADILTGSVIQNVSITLGEEEEDGEGGANELFVTAAHRM
jgi:hypothetical protein